MLGALGGAPSVGGIGVNAAATTVLGSGMLMPSSRSGAPAEGATGVMFGVVVNSRAMMMRVFSYNNHSLRLRWFVART